MTVDTLIEDQSWDEIPGLESLAHAAVEAALAVARASDLREAEVSLLFTSDERVRELNRDYRGKNSPTNVLSFPYGDQPRGDGAPRVLGDIVLASGIIAEEARVQGKPLATHACHLIVHGMLHLLGFDHEDDGAADAMEALEVRALGLLGLPDPYVTAGAPEREAFEAPAN